MGAMASQPFIQAKIKEKNQSSASLDFVRGIHRWPVNSPHKWPVTRKMFPFDDVIMFFVYVSCQYLFAAVVERTKKVNWPVNVNVMAGLSVFIDKKLT